MHPNTFSVYWEIQSVYDDYMQCLSSVTPFRRLILCLSNRNYMSDKVRHLFQTVFWWNSFIFFLFAFVCLIQRNPNTSHMFAVFTPEGFPFLSGCSASLKVGGGVRMLILLIAACKAPSCRWCSFYCCWWKITWETVANIKGTTVLLPQIRAH